MKAIAITITIKITKTIIIKKEITARMIITFINKILAYINQNYLIFLNAQNVVNIIIDDDNNTHNNLMNKNEKVDHVKITSAKTSIAFKLTRVNSRFDANRAKIIHENTYITKINENLTRVNAISQTFINFF